MPVGCHRGVVGEFPFPLPFPVPGGCRRQGKRKGPRSTGSSLLQQLGYHTLLAHVGLGWLAQPLSCKQKLGTVSLRCLLSCHRHTTWKCRRQHPTTRRSGLRSMWQWGALGWFPLGMARMAGVPEVASLACWVGTGVTILSLQPSSLSAAGQGKRQLLPVL